jgi:hypothetical protein
VGVFTNPQSVAVDSAGDVYVYDAGAEGGSIYKFDAAGNPVSFSALGMNVIANVGARSPDEEEIAVSSAGPTRGDIYLANGFQLRVYNAAGEKLEELTEPTNGPWGEPCGVAVDPAGNVYVGLENRAGSDSVVNKYVPASNPVTNADYQSSLWQVNTVCNIAVDNEGSVYVDTFRAGPVTKYPASQFRPPPKPPLPAEGIEVDKAGSTLAADPQVHSHVWIDEQDLIAEYETAGVKPKRLGVTGNSGPGTLQESFGIAVAGASSKETPYVSDTTPNGVVNIYGPAVVIPDVTTGAASNVRQTTATVEGVVNPDGAEVSSCEFEYSTGGSPAQTTPCSPSPGSGNTPVAVQADLTGLRSGSTYSFRLVAGNANGTNRGGEEQHFMTQPPAIDAEWATNVTARSATLSAQVNPQGLDITSCEFEYGTTLAYGKSVSCSPSPGAGTSDMTVSASPQDLSPGTTYHYRVTVTNADGTVPGEDTTFTTQTIGEFKLPDGREWELVSPADKHGANLLGIGAGARRAVQAAAAGDAMTYMANAPTEPSPPGNFQTHVLSTRGPAGWRSLDLTIPHLEGLAITLEEQEFELFSSDLSLAAVRPFGGFDPALSAQASEQTAYLRTNFAAGDVGASCTTACYRPLVTGKPGYANVPDGTRFGTEGECQNGTNEDKGPVGCGPQFEGATPDFAHIVLCSSVPLTTVAAAEPKVLYEWTEGSLKIVSVLPEGEGGGAVSATLGQGARASHGEAISADGTRIVWTAANGHLYVSDTAGAKTTSVRLDEGLAGKPAFQAANAQGTRIFFTENGDLYEYDVEHGKREALTTGAEVQRFILGASEDGSWVYFVADGAIPGVPGAVEKAPNLYVRHADTTKLVAVLSSGPPRAEGDAPDWAHEGGIYESTARVSSSGRWLAFMSRRSLTGYDNRDAVSGQPDEEVFLYDGEAGRLVCVSCNPTGARPQGREGPGRLTTEDLALGSEGTWQGDWVAANVPGWTLPGYQSRYLSDSGRLFFNSSDVLVPRDVNEQEDVYEFEPSGVGGCTTSTSTGSWVYSPSAAGCVGLISSGSSPEESVFLDASETGEDVFFLTSARLVPEDFDSSLDVYDAHECTPVSPCLPAAAAQPPACTTESSCRAAATPQPGIFGAPASATFAGPGNVPALISASPVKVKPLTRSQKLGKALAACKRKYSRAKKKRHVCEAQAKRRYSAKSRAKKAKAHR